ncbi:MAG: head-tail joining protein [Aeromonas sp.]
MGNPFHKAQRRIINRLGRHNKVTIVTELGEERDIRAIFTDPQSTGSIRKTGSGSGGSDFKQSAKQLLAMAEDVEGINPEWRITVNGTEYFPADHDPDGDGALTIYLARQQPQVRPRGDAGGW